MTDISKNKHCKICNSHTETIIDKQFDIEYHYCTNCEFIFEDKKYIVSAKEEVGQYENHENSIENEGYVNMFEKFIVESIEPYQEDLKTVLDFGCGPGPVLSELMKKRGFDVEVYDPYFSPEKVYEGKEYDIITSTEVFEHFSNPLKEMETLKEHLNSDGILAIMTLFHKNDEEHFKKWWYRRDPTHISFYTPKTMGYIADKFNMEVLKITDKNVCVLRKK